MKNKNIIHKLTSEYVVLGVQAIATIVFLFFVFKLNIIPMKYTLPVSALIALLMIIYYAIIRSGKKKSEKRFSKRVLGTKIVSILTSIVLVVGAMFVIRSDNFMSSLTAANTDTFVVSIIVLNDSVANELEDLDGNLFGVSYKNDSKIIAEAVADFEERLGNSQTLEEADDYVLLADQLYQRSVDAIIVGEEYRTMLEANHENFGAETKVIATYEVTKETTSATTPTNVTKNPFTLYITGIDTYGSITTVARSDVNLLVTINPTTKQILMTSVPRDIEVILATSGQMDKITHAGIYGINETIMTIEDLLEVDINYFARTNFSGIVDIIDALGGVEIDSPHEFTTLHGGYLIEKGINKMDGDKALCFVRERYALPQGDFDRGKNQMLLLSAMLDKVMSPAIITNFNSILSAVEGTFETDMLDSDIKALLNMQLNDMSGWTIHSVQVTGSGYMTSKTYSMWGTEVYVTKPDTQSLIRIQELIDRVEDGEILTDKDLEGLNGTVDEEE